MCSKPPLPGGKICTASFCMLTGHISPGALCQDRMHVKDCEKVLISHLFLKQFARIVFWLLAWKTTITFELSTAGSRETDFRVT